MIKETKAVVKSPGKSIPRSREDLISSIKCLEASASCLPELAACRAIEAVHPDGLLDSNTLVEGLRKQVLAVKGGDLSHAEAMLISQATALQSIFARLVERGMGQSLRANTEMFLKLGLRAQNQCRATLETLANIKNPPNVSFVKQANIANGPQQVNNGAEASPARENKIEQTQLLEVIPNERLDFGATEKAIGNDQVMEPVEAINRATNRGRKTEECKARI